ncbi:Fc.00g005790.m01.CDS01 [Cosmosporella sp. VM-42]
MQLSTILLSTLAAVASAAPSYPKYSTKDARSAVDTLGHLSGYFNLIAGKVQAARISATPPVCDLSKAQMPTIPDLPPPTAGLKVKHVAVGRGTQNYTCDTTTPSNPPVAAGALATLFNASCVAALYEDLLEQIPGMAVHFNLTGTNQLGPSMLPISGHHYFTNATTPFFDLRTKALDVGEAPCAKNNSIPAPANAAVGQLGEAAVPWLKLTTRDGATGNIQEVYRVTTAGGSPPANCAGMPAQFQVQYSSVYWFWEGDQ